MNKTFKRYQVNHEAPMSHCDLCVDVSNSEESYTVVHNELSDDYAHVNHARVIRSLIKQGYQEVE